MKMDPERLKFLQRAADEVWKEEFCGYSSFHAIEREPISWKDYNMEDYYKPKPTKYLNFQKHILYSPTRERVKAWVCEGAIIFTRPEHCEIEGYMLSSLIGVT